MAGDDPRFEGCDLAGLALDVATARTACAVWRAVIDQQMQKNWGSKLLAIGGSPPQVFWCKTAVAELDDLKGCKIRVFNNAMRDFMTGLGASSISMSFPEVVPALNNGVVDCAVTGTLSGNTAGWLEVTKTIYPLSLGWSINAKAVNLAAWNKMPPPSRRPSRHSSRPSKTRCGIRSPPRRRRPRTATSAASPASWDRWPI